jgi:hypothetical protein
MLKHWPQGLQIGFSNSLVSFFLRHWGQYKAIKNFNELYGLVSTLLYTKAIKFFKVNWGHFEKVFKNFSLDP